ncbi:MAG: MFS transporter [Bacteroidales bacterium]|nr:MFS transporter [Bacteroidales bacterium]
MAKKNGNIVGIITMIFLFGMISFVTNLAAPIGNIWKMQPQIAGSNTLGMMGNMMNFLAYLFMGIPAGNMLKKYGYKKTALVAIAVGFIGVFVQYLSGVVGAWPMNFVTYLLGAFISGFSVCMLNTVVNPMLNLLGGGGNKGNQYIQYGGSFNSLMATLTPMLVGVMIGTLTPQTKIVDVNPVLFLAMGIFLLAFIILLFIPISDPEQAEEGEAASPFKYSHFIWGIIAIFVYVGVEVGIPGTLNFYLADSVKGAGLDPSVAVRTAGFVAGTYWLLMLVGRLVSSAISGKVSSRTQLSVVATVAILLVLAAMFVSPSVQTKFPAFTGKSFEMVTVPLSALLLVLCGLCTSVMWGAIFNLAVEGLGKATAQASGIFMMMVVGGGILPLVQNFIADKAGYMPSYWVVIFGLAIILYFALIGSKVKKVNA